MQGPVFAKLVLNYTGTSAFADVSYIMADVDAIFLYKNVLNISQNAVIG